MKNERNNDYGFDEESKLSHSYDVKTETLTEEIIEYGKQDSRFSWITCALNFWITYFIFGVQYTSGIVLQPIADDLGVKIGSVSLAFSMSTSFMFLLGIVAGYLTDRHSVRWVVFFGGLLAGVAIFLSSFVTDVWQLSLSYGVVFGFASSLVFIPSSTNLTQWFQKYRGIGVGLAFSGSSLGNLTLPWICVYIESRYGWRSFYMVLGEVSAIMLMLLAIPLKRRTPPAKKADYTIKPYLSSRIFYILIISSFFQAIAYLIPITFIVNYSEHVGLSEFEATIPLSFMGVANIIGRLGLGYLSDKVNRLRLFQSSLLIMTIVCYVWYFCTDLISISAFTFFFGILAGTIISTFPVIVADYYPAKVLGAMLSLVYVSRGVGYLVGPPFAGYSFDFTQSYTITIMICATSFLISTITSFLLPSQTTHDVISISEK